MAEDPFGVLKRRDQPSLIGSGEHEGLYRVAVAELGGRPASWIPPVLTTTATSSLSSDVDWIVLLWPLSDPHLHGASDQLRKHREPNPRRPNGPR